MLVIYSNAFCLRVEVHAGYYQELTEYTTNNPRKFFRNFYNNTWGPWYEVNYKGLTKRTYLTTIDDTVFIANNNAITDNIYIIEEIFSFGPIYDEEGNDTTLPPIEKIKLTMINPTLTSVLWRNPSGINIGVLLTNPIIKFISGELRLEVHAGLFSKTPLVKNTPLRITGSFYFEIFI